MQSWLKKLPRITTPIHPMINFVFVSKTQLSKSKITQIFFLLANYNNWHSYFEIKTDIHCSYWKSLHVHISPPITKLFVIFCCGCSWRLTWCRNWRLTWCRSLSWSCCLNVTEFISSREAISGFREEGRDTKYKYKLQSLTMITEDYIKWT